MQICHGRRRCSLTADSSTFGRPCKQETRVYLKVVYTCGKGRVLDACRSSVILTGVISVPRKVLKDRYDTATTEPDEPQQTDPEQDQDDLYDDDQFYRENEAIPPAPKLLGGLSKNRFLDSSTLQPFYDLPGRPREDHHLEGKHKIL